jgi:hypothetical protein
VQAGTNEPTESVKNDMQRRKYKNPIIFPLTGVTIKFLIMDLAVLERRLYMLLNL